MGRWIVLTISWNKMKTCLAIHSRLPHTTLANLLQKRKFREQEVVVSQNQDTQGYPQCFQAINENKFFKHQLMDAITGHVPDQKEWYRQLMKEGKRLQEKYRPQKR